MISRPATKTSGTRTNSPSAPFAKHASDIVEKINKFNNNKTSNRLYSGYIGNTISSRVVDAQDLIINLNEELKSKSNIQDLFTSVQRVFTDKLRCSFTAFGLLP
jgi:hypothetical protein